MTRGRPRTVLGTFGEIAVNDIGGRYRASTRHRDLDGRLRRVTATATSKKGAEALLKRRLLDRSGYGSGGVLSLASPFPDLAELWLADLELRDISEGTKDNYRDDLRLHVRPFFENYTLGEITTGRVEHFLKSERRISYSRAKHSRTVLNQLFTFALRHDSMPRNPVEGTSPLARPKNQVQAMTLEQVQAIRAAAAAWRTGPGVRGPKPDGQVKDAIEVLLGTSMRPGEVLALRPCDIVDGEKGMVAHVRGTVAYREGRGTFRQDHPKTERVDQAGAGAGIRRRVIRRRIAPLPPAGARPDDLCHRRTRPAEPAQLPAHLPGVPALAGLENSGITPRWYRRTGRRCSPAAWGVDVAATHLGHTSKAITEAHYIEPDLSIDFSPAEVLQRTLRGRPGRPGRHAARPSRDRRGRRSSTRSTQPSSRASTATSPES